MPVIAAAVVTATGKILLSRQFMDTTRIRIEGLVAAFPKLVTGSKVSQSTYIDNGAVRYVYQPVEALFLVLVTTRNSNIVEDLASLRLLGRLINEYAGTTPDEISIGTKAFEICFAMDEVITGGYREPVTIETVLTTLAMQSNEEEKAKADEEIAKENAKREAKKKAQEIRARKAENSLSNDSGAGQGFASSASEAAPDAPRRPTEAVVIDTTVPKRQTATVGGMSLSKAGRKTDQASRVLVESGSTPVTAAPAAPSAPLSQPSNEGAGASAKIEEKISVTLNREGGVSSVEIKGELLILVTDPSVAPLKVRLAPLPQEEFNFKTHPNINKALFQSDSVIITKDNKPFPVNASLVVLKYGCQALTRTKIPLSVNCWPSDDSVSIEFELENKALRLQNVIVSLPLAGGFPTVEPLEVGTYKVDSGKSMLYWEIPLIDKSRSSGTLTVQLNKAVGADAFFPTTVSFVSATSIANVQVIEGLHTESGKAVPLNVETVLTTSEYIVA